MLVIAPVISTVDIVYCGRPFRVMEVLVMVRLLNDSFTK